MKPENFFQLNLPYGMEENPFTHEWALFNADHTPWDFTPPIRWDANAILCSPIIIMG